MEKLERHKMAGVFSTLMAAARAPRHIQRLHFTALPANCRLMQPDYLTMFNVWRHDIWNGSPPNGTTIPLASFKRLIDTVRGDRNLTAYYASQFAGRPNVYTLEGMMSADVSHLTYTGATTTVFQTSMHGMDVRVQMLLTRSDRKYLLIKLSVPISELTEETTYNMTCNERLRSSYSDGRIMWTKVPAQMDCRNDISFVLALHSAELTDQDLEREPISHPIWGNMRVLTDHGLARLTATLRRNGVLVRDIRLLT